MTNLPIRRVTTDLLEVAYHEAGPAGGRPVVLLHGFPYDIHSYARRGAAHFTGRRVHRQVHDAGHNLPQEAPEAFADAVREVAR
ncbi:alpha/beta hydrolase [Paractinoplanes rhizophilus]|jgi:pimeloyl-ACP methyl ester carboxylesterase|uniref:Alpha/beta hydrolase n=1 Tax=Paractinoplanes rhizophilus TaxID=1416877 RepID=A0ABW2HVV4_9ACTN|nr:hypothetical protein [Actinoplanes sp.]